jgi:hypothetical protein
LQSRNGQYYSVSKRAAHSARWDEELMNLIGVINAFVLIAGGILAASAVIVARRPDAQYHINKLIPFQAIIGVSLLVLGFINLLKSLEVLKEVARFPVFGASALSVIGCSLLLGFLFGMPVITKLIPGNSSAEQKMAEIASNIAGLQIMIGLLGMLGSLVYLVFQIGRVTPM